MSGFVHLHTHSDFSLLDGAASIEGLVRKAVSLKMPALALTDHGNMFGVLKFYKECLKNKIKPVIGSEFYIAPGSRFKKSGTEKGTRHFHMVLLARNEEGYKNLIKLSSLAYTEGFYYKPRIDNELLEKYSAGLLCLSGCLAGEIPRLLAIDRIKEAGELALYYQGIFGKDNYYLELQDHGIENQKKVNRGLLEIHRKTGIPLAATNDVHYLDRDDARAQDILICIGTNKKVNEGKRLKFEFPEFYFKSLKEMEDLFGDIPESISNTVEIAEKCNVKIPLPGPQLPAYKVPEGSTRDEYLAGIAHKGLLKRYDTVTEEMKRRLDYELSVITSMGFTGYFLIVWDFIKFAKEHGIPVGPGRGSGAGSLVAYSLRITDIDPLKYGLLFERFLNPERVSMPDFDIDFCYERRGEVIDYVTKKYGENRVSQIITFGTLKPRAVIRDVARVLDIPYADADGIAKMVPYGPKMNFEKALKLEPRLKEIANRGEKYRELLETSIKLEGLNRHASTHAAGIVIGRDDLTNYVPLYREAKTGTISTQYTMDYLEECGLVKMDFLGLKTLTLIANTLKLIRESGVELDINSVPDNDPATFKMLAEGKSTCVFQFESSGMRAILKRTKPERIEELIALNALYRPGPMEYIDQFINSKLGKRSIEYPLPELEPILKETYGVIVYQEQVMEIARKVAGFSLGQADILRRAMGKKKPKVMAEQKDLFIQGALKNGYKKTVAAKIFDMLIPFAGYGFNKSHAAAYSILAYHTAYLKTNYPAEFMAANLTNEIHDTDKLSGYIKEAREMGIKVLPPDINLSKRDFSVSAGRIVYGLRGIKNVGKAAVEEIIRKREEAGRFKSFIDFLENVSLKTVNRKVVETLVFSGVFDSFKENRATLVHNLDRVLDIVAKTKEGKKYGQTSLFESGEEGDYEAIQFEKTEEWPEIDRLLYEKQNLGFFFSGHPLDSYRGIVEKCVNLKLSEIEKAQDDRIYTVIGILNETREIITKNGKRMAFAKVDDYTGSVEVVIFSDVFEKVSGLLVAENILAVNGRVDKSRGNPKIIAEEIMEPEKLNGKDVKTVHVRISKELKDEDNLMSIRDFLIERKGKCSLYFHLDGVIIKASSQLKVSDDDDVVARLKSYPQVVEVWKE
ncbi:MAG: DNA polymerase III subunit alpha [Spirochaetes bacterium]|nr:DNA polymerase III subunit alpha [Spirochaetota bacterium]